MMAGVLFAQLVARGLNACALGLHHFLAQRMERSRPKRTKQESGLSGVPL